MTRPSRLARLRPLLALPPILAGAGLLALAVATREAPGQRPEAETARTVRVLTVAPGPFLPRVSGFGVVEPARSWAATAQVAGRVAELAPDFRRGARVAAGTTVARIADADYRIARAQAAAQLAAIDARLAELELNVANARESLGLERESLALHDRELARQRDLVERGAASAATLDAQERQTLVQRARVQDLENRIALAPEQRRALEQERAVAEAALERAELDLARTAIVAPFDARVAEVSVERDQFVPVGATLGRLHGTARAEVDVQLPQSRMRDFGRLVFGPSGVSPTAALGAADAGARLSAELRLRFEDGVATWPAEVSRPSASVDPAARAFGVILGVDDPFEGDPMLGRPPLFTGLFVEARIAGPVLEDALAVPRAAVRGGAVFVADAEERLRRRPVTVAMTADGAALISAGLSPGDRVVLTDLPAAVEGMRLAPVEDAAAAARLAAAAAGAAGEAAR
ncbi:MAG: efflux RND transporter periplasmic adaptor subunit [Paracoccaceae bacterium]